MSTHYDAIVIGSGQGGTPLASAFAIAWHRTALIERAHLGGCCVNDGCTPTKTMIASGRAAYLARRGADYGVATGAIAVDQAVVRQRKRDIVATFRLGSERGVQAAGVDVVHGTARFQDARTLRVRLNAGSETTLTADRIFINVGERPARPAIPGADTVSADVLLDSTSVQELDAVPEHLIVIGGGYVGLEFGQLFRRLGASVTVLQRAGRLMPREDPEVSDALLAILQEDGIAVHLGTTPSRLAPGTAGHAVAVTVRAADGADTTLQGSHVLYAAGRVPNTDALDLPAAGIRTTATGHVAVTPRLETSAPGVYALGDVTGGPAFTHISYDDFRILKANLLDQVAPLRSTAERVVPYVAYTDPQLGHVGLHAAEAVAKYGADKVQTASMPMSWVARALETDERRGLMKAVVAKDTGRVLGFSCLGIEGGELMAVVMMAMAGGLSWRDLRDAPFAHPSLAESLNNVWGQLK